MDLFGLQEDYVKTLIMDTIETYSGQWRIVHEAIQNSHDAIQLNEKLDQGKISIDLHIGTNKVIVKDNGKGIPIEEFPTIFTLGGTVKKDRSLRKVLKGSQGVGIKSTVFTSKFFKIETQNANSKWVKKVENCWDFMNPDFDDHIDEPKPQKTESSPSFTKVSYSLHDYSVKDFFQEIITEYCDELKIDNIESEQTLFDIIELYFRTQTYLGCVQSLLGIGHDLKPIRVKINIILDYPTLGEHRRNVIEKCSFLSTDEYHGRTLENEFPAFYIDYEEIHQTLNRSNQVDRLFGHISEVIENPPDPNLKKVLIQKFKTDQTKMLLSQISRDRSTGGNHLVEIPEKLEKYSRLLERMNGIYLIIGPRQYLTKFLRLSPKQLISINGLPTNIVLNPPKGAGELGYLLNIHLIIDLDTTLGFGKRNIPSVTKGKVDAFFAEIFGLLRRLARAIVGEREAVEPFGEVWDKEELFDAYRNTDNLFKDMDLPLKLPPLEEQDVICLFHELLGSEKLKSYYPFRTSDYKIYDSLMYISEESDGSIPTEIRWNDLKIIEFKVKLSSLIQEFVDDKKFLRDIDLAVVWEDDYDGDTEYIVSSLGRDGLPPLGEAQKRIRSGTQSCQVLILKDFLFPDE